jgi:hypothetical protein
MTTQQPVDLEQLRAILAKMTPGEWTTYERCIHPSSREGPDRQAADARDGRLQRGC